MIHPRRRALLTLLAPLAVVLAVLAATAAPSSAINLLVGRSTLAQLPNDSDGQVDSNPAGTAEAFQYTAIQTGTADTIELYVDSSSTATNLKLGLYTDDGSNDPGSLIASGSTSSLTTGWNSVTISGSSITSGTKYWLAALSTSGTLAFLDDAHVGSGVGSQTNGDDLTALPSTWGAGSSFSTYNASLFAGAS